MDAEIALTRLLEEWDNYLRRLKYVGPPPLPRAGRTPVRVALSDTVSAEFRQRKPDPEFPLSLDTLEAALLPTGLAWTDYVFLPPLALQQALRAAGQVLLTLGVRGQTRYPVKAAAVWGLNLMNYGQVPAFFSLLQLAGVPARRADRAGAAYPLIVLGGHIWPNPLPLADFYDVLVVGDGEDVLAQLVELLAEQPADRAAVLAAVARRPGAFVPGYTTRPVRRVYIDFAAPAYAAGSAYVLAGVGAVALSRSCPYACAFCNSRQVGGPYRVKPYAQVVAQIDRLRQAGAQKIMLLAASASHYRSGTHTLRAVLAYLRRHGLTARSMSDRPEHFTAAYLRQLAPARGKVVLAPEASPAVRLGVLQKTLREATLWRAVAAAIAAGVNQLQLYAIVAIPPISPGVVAHLPDGFPGEQPAHLRYLADLSMAIADRLRQAGLPRPPARPYVRLDCMPFIPALGTGLQRAAWPAYAAYQQSLARLRALLRPEYSELVEVSPGLDERAYWLQAVLERGPAGVGQVVWEVWRQRPAAEPEPEDLQRALRAAGYEPATLLAEYRDRPLPYAGLIEEAVHGRTGGAARK